MLSLGGVAAGVEGGTTAGQHADLVRVRVGVTGLGLGSGSGSGSGSGFGFGFGFGLGLGLGSGSGLGLGTQHVDQGDDAQGDSGGDDLALHLPPAERALELGRRLGEAEGVLVQVLRLVHE